MRVLHFAATAGLGRGEAFVDLANRMAIMGAAGALAEPVEVGLLVPTDAKYKQRIAEPITVLEHRTRSRGNPLLWLEIAQQIKAFQPDLVHTHFAKATELYRRVHGWVGVPYVATKHNPRKAKVFGKAPCVIAVARDVAASIRGAILADAMPTASDSAGGDVSTTPGPLVTVIYNGIEATSEAAFDARGATNSARIAPQSDRSPDAIAERALHILAIGRLDPIKGFDRLIRALAQVSLPWRLTIAGDGPQRAELEALIAEQDVTDRVELAGFRSDVPEMLRTCDLFIQSSHSEGFGMALLEAMRDAPLAISTRVGLAAELFPEWLLWDPPTGEALQGLLAKYAELQPRAWAWTREQLPDFTLDRTVEQHLTLYRRVLAEAHGQRRGRQGANGVSA